MTLQCIGRVGQVTKLLEHDVLVKFSGIERVWRINPAVLSPAVLLDLQQSCFFANVSQCLLDGCQLM